MRPITLEIAVTTIDEAVSAVAAGADRLELGAALDIGGVTPSPGTFLAVRDALPQVSVCVLLRPRGGGFTYSDAELAALKRDAVWFLSHGAATLVFGFLTENGTIDRDRCRELVQLAGGRAVFHRAFDFIADQAAALEQLVDLGFIRVLTSGGAATAFEGRERLAELIRRANGRIEVLPGGGVRPDNALELVQFTSCDQVHAALRTPTTPVFSDNHPLAIQMGGNHITDPARVCRLRMVLDMLSNQPSTTRTVSSHFQR